MNVLIPTVIEKERDGERAYDIYSRLLKDRIVFVTGHIDSAVSNTVIAQLLFLDKENPKEDIRMYINTPGGIVNDGLAILDTMNFVRCDVTTIAVGMAASMGCILLAGGKKGKRFSLPNAQILMHQPIGGAEGQATDIDIAAKEILKTRERLYKMLSKFSGKSIKQIEKDADRDKYFTAQEALEYGLIDRIER